MVDSKVETVFRLLTRFDHLDCAVLSEAGAEQSAIRKAKRYLCTILVRLQMREKQKFPFCGIGRGDHALE